MDTRIEKRKQALWMRFWPLLALGAIALVAALIRTSLGNASYTVSRKDVQIAAVDAGHFQVNVRGTGILKPLYSHWEIAQVDGRVDKVLAKPGKKVEKDEAIIVLSNPKLIRQFEESSWELTAEQAQVDSEIVAMEVKLAELKVQISEAKLHYDGAKLQLDAESKLVKMENNAVSGIQHLQTKLNFNEKKQTWKGLEDTLEKKEREFKSKKIALEARLTLLEKTVEWNEFQVSNLTVRAASAGTVQQSDLELGQKIMEGDSIALITDDRNYIAELQIQELQVKEVKVGQHVKIDTRNAIIDGEVIRVDPSVENGLVQVDVALTGALTDDVRLDLNVEGLIQVSDIDEALFVSRPHFVQKYTNAELYVVSNENIAKKTLVEFGQSSATKIQVLSGLRKGDQIITSDASSWSKHSEILIR